MRKMKIFILVLLTIFVLIGIVIFKRIHDYLYTPQKINLVKLYSFETHDDIDGPRWNIIRDNSNPYLEEYNIGLSDIDFNENIIIISFEHKIKRLTYTRISKRHTPFKDPYIGIVVYEGKKYSNTIFVYKIKKINLIDEEDAGYLEKIRIED